MVSPKKVDDTNIIQVAEPDQVLKTGDGFSICLFVVNRKTSPTYSVRFQLGPSDSMLKLHSQPPARR